MSILSQSGIVAQLKQGSLFNDIEVYDSVGSTNQIVNQAARDGRPEGLVVIAGEQTAGRGRFDRVWVSPPNASIAMSMLLRPKDGAFGWLPLLTGLAVAQALDEIAENNIKVELKWPNDVLLDGKKVCGILAEAIETKSRLAVIIGIGINISLTKEQLPVPNATSLSLAGLAVEANVLVAKVLNYFESLYTLWRTDGDFMPKYRHRCSSIGAQLTIYKDVENKIGPIKGFGCDIDEFGQLVIDSDGKLQSFAAGDVIHAKLE